MTTCRDRRLMGLEQKAFDCWPFPGQLPSRVLSGSICARCEVD